MDEIKTYLSYRRENGGLSVFAQSLLDWKPRDIDLQVDTQHAQPFRPIAEYLGQLKTSSSVVFLLNDRFFRSPWCMGELYTFLSFRNASFYGCFIACDNWLPQSDSDKFFDNLETTLNYHWNHEAEQAQTEEKRDRANQFSEGLPEIIRILRAINIPTQAQVVENQGKLVWMRIREQNERLRADYKPYGAKKFEDECRLRIIDRLEYSNLLRHKLATILRMQEADQASTLVNKLWQESVQNRLTVLYRCARSALRDCESGITARIKDDIREILAVLLLGFMDTKSRDQLLNPAQGMLDSETFDLRETDSEIAELCFASAEPTISAKFVYNAQQSRLEVSEERYYGGDHVQHAVRFSCNSILDSELRLIWNFTFPDEAKKNNDYLNDDEIKRLSRGLRRNFERGNARYYLLPAEKPQHPMHAEGVIEALKFKLPYLFILRTGVKSCPALIAADFAAFDIKDELASFAELFK